MSSVDGWKGVSGGDIIGTKKGGYSYHTFGRAYTNFYETKTEFEIASEYYPKGFKSGAFFDDEIDAVNEGRVEPIEDAWYRPFEPQEREAQKKIETPKLERCEDEVVYNFSKDFENSDSFDEDFDEILQETQTTFTNFGSDAICIDLLNGSNSDLSPEETGDSSDTEYIPNAKKAKTIKRLQTTKSSPKKKKKNRSRNQVNLEDVLNELGDNVRPYLDSCTSRKGDLICPECPRRFGSYKSLHTHLEIHLKGVFARCPLCQCVYPNKTHLIRHLHHHTNERTHICDTCGKSFFYDHCLKQHQQVHIIEKPFVCKFCMAKFARRANFRDHIRTHTGEKPYSCEFCHLKFQRGTLLKTHQKIHKGEAPFGCHICDDTFPTNELLQQHLYRHRNQTEISSSCNPDVPTSIQRTGTTSERTVTKSSEFPFECKVCGARFKKSFLRTKHINKHLESNSISVTYNECVNET